MDEAHVEFPEGARLFVLPDFVRDAMTLLGHDRPLYIALRERREQRRRWIERLSLQTGDPAEE